MLDKYHWMLYFLVTAMYPRFLITLDENLESKPVTVRVGQVSLQFFFVSLMAYPYSSHRLWTSSAKLANHAQYQASRRTRRLYDWVRQSARNWRRRSSSRMRMF